MQTSGISEDPGAPAEGGVEGEGARNVADEQVMVPSSASFRTALSRTPRRGPLISLTPMERRLVIGAGRVGATIADGLFLSSTAANPVLTVAFVAYESFRGVSDYRRGELNSLGYQTSRTDLALRVGKEIGTAAIGVAIGHGVGTLLSLSTVPVAGQIVVGTILSVTLGICVGTLLTRYADRIFVRLQLQTQYGYSPNEHKARKTFENLLESQHDLSSFEACRIVQHYRDYRVACGWESPTDVDDYRSSADITLMPVSFQHFAIVQLQRKWGFLNERGECKKVYKALMLVHHPDKGGNSEMAAQLNRDFEIYAFCQEWREDCPSIYQSDTEIVQQGDSATEFRGRRKNVLVAFLRSLFRSPSNSALEAEGLRQLGLLTLEAGASSELQRLDEVCLETMDTEETADDGRNVLGTGALVRQRSVARVLASIQRCYQLATESITFAGLVFLYKQPDQWDRLKRDVFVFNRMQTFVQITAEIQTADESSFLSTVRSCRGFSWRTKDDAVALRERCRDDIVSLCFPTAVSSKLMEALELWRAAQGLAKSFFRQCIACSDDVAAADYVKGTGQTIDTLLNIQKALQSLTDSSTKSWREDIDATSEESFDLSLVEEVRVIGLTASCALAGAHAMTVHEALQKKCNDFYKGRRRKLETITSLWNEIHDLRAKLQTTVSSEKRAEIQALHDDYMKELFLVDYTLSEVDLVISELYDVYTMHLPEKSGVLKTLSSSCARCVHEDLLLPRFVKYERERTLMNYMHLEVEPRNVMDRCTGPSINYEVSGSNDAIEEARVEFALLRAHYADPINGAVTPCWLKRYTFPENGAAKAEGSAVELFKHVMEHELRVFESCGTHRVTCATDVFCDEHTRQIFFHIPRGGTQLRFNSIHDISKKISRLGVRWLHDALHSIIDLHSCQLVHGAVCLSNFTFDEFGNTTLGFFSNALEDNSRRALNPLNDAVDFGATLYAEVLPYIGGASRATTLAMRPSAAGAARDKSSLVSESQVKMQEIFYVFQEVADRLVGKIEPRWSLLDARTFVRRFLEFSYDSDERNYLFTKEVSYPAYWATRRNIMPASLSMNRRVLIEGLPAGTCAFLNRSVHMWELYWKCRRNMVQDSGGGFFSMPTELRRQVPFLPCSDDCEVNERFLWYTCGGEEEAWQICLEGVRGATCRLCLWPPWWKTGGESGDNPAVWGIVFRASLGTVVREGDANTQTAQHSAERPVRDHHRHCVLRKCGKGDRALWEVVVPSPSTRCYPEYLFYLQGAPTP